MYNSLLKEDLDKFKENDPEAMIETIKNFIASLIE